MKTKKTSRTRSIIHKVPDEFHVFGFSRDLLAWYDRQKRDLPWRRDKDPYKIWVSEIMLQQTRVETVKPYFHNFIGKFPTVEALADAPEEEVLKAWEGLGYYSRARNLQAAAREVKAKYGGKVPNTPEEIAGLKGIGPYTAGAILSIAYDMPEPAVDGNVMRVFSRLLLVQDDIAKPATRVKFEQLVRQIIPADRAGDFNQALMELGALICVPKNPQCLTCPVFDYCLARKEGVQDQVPVKGKAKPPRPVQLASALVYRGNEWMIRKRPLQGLLAGLWEFPTVEVADRRTEQEELEEFLLQTYGVTAVVQDALPMVSHTFSHLHWDVQVYVCEWLEGEPLTADTRFVAQEELSEFPFSVVHGKMRAYLLD